MAGRADSLRECRLRQAGSPGDFPFRFSWRRQSLPRASPRPPPPPRPRSRPTPRTPSAASTRRASTTTRRLQGKPPTIDGRLDDEAWKQGEWAGNYTQQHARPRARRRRSRPSSRSSTTTSTSTSRSAPTTTPTRSTATPAAATTSATRSTSSASASTATTTSAPASSSTSPRAAARSTSSSATARRSGTRPGTRSGTARWPTTRRAGRRSSACPSTSCATGRRSEQVWGMHAWRWIDRNQEESQWQLIPRQNTGRMYQLGELHGIRGLPRSRHVELLPARGRQGELRARPSPAGAPTARARSGLDAKVGLTTNFTLDATVNPDFGQVEADPSVVNLTAYETFYEEKRPFFLEGRKILAFGSRTRTSSSTRAASARRPSYVPPLGRGRDDAPAREHDHPGRGQGHGQDRRRPLGRRAPELHPEGDRADLTSPLGIQRARRRAVRQLHASGACRRTGTRATPASAACSPRRTAGSTTPRSRSCPRRPWTGGARLHALLRRPLLGARGERRLQPRARATARPSARCRRTRCTTTSGPTRATSASTRTPTSLSGHGGSVRFGRSGKGRLRLTDHFHWYSPGLDLNDVGYLRQADLMANQVFLGWSEPKPKGPFRDVLLPALARGRVGLRRARDERVTGPRGRGAVQRTSGRAQAHFAFDAGGRHAGPARRPRAPLARLLHAVPADAAATPRAVRRSRPRPSTRGRVDDDSRSTKLSAQLNLRPSNRLSLSGAGLVRDEDRQPAVRRHGGRGRRAALGARAASTRTPGASPSALNLAITPDLTLQYYGSPFIGTGRYTAFKKATDTLATGVRGPLPPLRAGRDRVRRGRPTPTDVTRPGGGALLVRQPRLQLPRSSARTSSPAGSGSPARRSTSSGRRAARELEPSWEDSFHANWDASGARPPDNVFLVKLSYWFSP